MNSVAPSSLYHRFPIETRKRAIPGGWSDAFGATTTMERPDDDDGIQHAEMRLGDGVVTVFTDRAGVHPTGAAGESVGFGLAFTLGLPMKSTRPIESAIGVGATAVIEPAETEWGNYRCRVRDLEGYEWTFGTVQPGRAAMRSEEPATE